MADKTVKLRVILEAAGIKPTTEQLKRLNKEMQKTAGGKKRVSHEANKLKRNLEGVAQRAGSTGKDFSRMAQGMGGLVQAYATVAANVFALSSAFLVLRRAADLSSMTKSAEDFSNRFGVSVVEITKRMQEAAGGALDFAEALPTINKAVSAGIGIDKMEQLTKAATKAAQTFGGSATEALSRFISASQRGRVEIIQTLGVVIKTEQAYKDYAASVGKTALELTAFDRQQAILNATIEESNRVFAGIKIDPNPFQQFLTTMVDLKNTILTTITDAITPFVNLINKSIPAALILMGLLIKSIIGRIFPFITTALASATKAGIESSRAVTDAQITAKNKRLAILKKEVIQVKGLTKKQITAKLNLILNAHNEELKENKGFNAKILNQDGTVNAVRLANLKAFLGRMAALRAKGTILKGTEGLSVTAGTNARNLAAALGVQSGVFKAAAKDQANYSVAIGVTTNRIREFGRTTTEVFGRIRLTIASTSSAFKSGFANTFGLAQQGLAGFKTAIISATSAWRILARDVFVGGKVISHTLLTLGKVAGRTLGIIAGGLAAIAGPIFTFFLFLGLAKVAWDALNVKFNEGAKRLKKLKEGFSSLNDGLQDITDRTNKYTNSNIRATKSTFNFIKSLEFIRGTIDSTLTVLRDFDLSFSKSFQGKGIRETADRINELNTQLEEAFKFAEQLSKAAFAPAAAGIAGVGLIKAAEFKNVSIELEGQNRLIKLSIDDLKLLKEAFKSLGAESGKELAANFTALNNLFKAKGIADLDFVFRQLEDNLDGSELQVSKLIAALKTQNVEAFGKALNELPLKDIAETFNILTGAIGETEKVLSALSTQVSSGRALEDLDNRISNFVSGIDKLKAASVPNKEMVNFLIDAKNAFTSIQKAAEVAGNLRRATSDVIGGEDLKVLKQFFDIKDAESFEKVIGIINKQFKVFKDIIDDAINASKELKIVNLQLKTLKLEEITTDSRRLGVVRETNVLLIKRAEIERKSVIINIRGLNAELASLTRTGQINSERAKQIRSNLEVQRETLTVRNAEISTLKASKDEERKVTEIILERLSSVQQISKVQIQTSKILKSLSKNNKEDLKLRLEIFSEEKKALQVKKSELNIRIATLSTEKLSTEQEILRTNELRAQIALIDAQMEQKERQRLFDLAEKAEQEGTSIFDEKGLELAAQFFVRKVRDEARNLKTTFQILGEGFVDVINDSFDTMVDNLLEGGKDFGRVVVETIKAGLRDVFGEALKTQIRDAFAGIFNIETQEAAIAKRHEEAQLGRTAVIAAVASNTEALDKNTAKRCEGVEAATGALPSVFNQGGGATGPLEEAFKVFTGISEEGNKGLTVVQDLLGIGNETASGAKEEASTGFIGMVHGITTLIAVLASTSTKEGIGSIFGGIFGKAAGGIIPGGTNFTQRAAGTITNGPELALIGEGRRDEAVVPLPNNREIPVDLKGASGDTISIEQNFDFSNADASAIPRLRAEAKAIEQRTFNRVFSEINKGGKFAKMAGRR